MAIFSLVMGVLGYNVPRPREENYSDFLGKLVHGFRVLGIDELSLMLYGSFVRGDCIFGRSDIDAVLIFPGGPVIDKQELRRTASVFRRASEGNNVPFQVTVTDLATMSDGRFNSYNPSFEEYFNEEGRVVLGPDYRAQFRFQMPAFPDQHELTFNLRKMRLGLFFAEHERHNDYERFLQRFCKCLDGVSRGSKQILYLVDGRLRANRFSALEVLAETFPGLDVNPLVRLKHLYSSLDELDQVFHDPDKVIEEWENGVTFLETLIGRYIEMVNPK